MSPTDERDVRRCPCPSGAPSRWQPPPFTSDRRCVACAYRDLAAHLPRAARWSWGTFPRLPELRPAYESAREWLDDYLEGAESNLFIFGPPGVAKTGLAWAIARSDFENGGAPEFINVRRWLRDLRAGYSAPELGEYDPADPDPYERLRVFGELLVLDDVGAERPTAWALEELAGLVEARYDAGHGPSVVTTNYAPADLARKLGGRRDAVAGERIVSRLLEGARRIEVDGPNLRLSPGPSGEAPRLQVVEGAGARTDRLTTRREEKA